MHRNLPEGRPLRCLVVDDEPPARSILERYIADLPALELAGSCAHALEALQALQQTPVDLLFLDIHMPQLKGNELLKILKAPPRVIFTTAHPEYALEGYELDVVDYLLKPIRFDRFVKAVNKLYMMERAPLPEPARPPAPARQEPFIYLRADRRMVKVLLQDILYVESMKDYVKVFTASEIIITKQSISGMEAMLPEGAFVRVHRSFIVSVNKVRTFTHELIGIGNTEIPIGKLYRQSVLRALSGGGTLAEG
ncbi:LytTR family DNA-binding domain-containing protein [Flaviaesturariibacter amylovorans]|uniref:LytTR family DNA-binding domain-containing protein n=1 Tax=Flaviaesturariibacter amylovorans TaxID=1084520 RepID=A0ABP8GMK4_9BACT